MLSSTVKNLLHWIKEERKVGEVEGIIFLWGKIGLLVLRKTRW